VLWIDWLLQELDEAGGQHTGAWMLASVGGGGDDGDGVEDFPRQPLQLADEPVAVLADHRDVTHDDVRPHARRERDRVPRVVGGRDLGPACGERDAEELEDVDVIVDDQDAQADENSLQRSRSLPRALLASERSTTITRRGARTRPHVMRMLPPMRKRIGARGGMRTHCADYKPPRSTVKRYSRYR
jgi:hypothetical protein